MSSESTFFKPGLWCIKLLLAVFIAALLLLGTDRPYADSGVVSAGQPEQLHTLSLDLVRHPILNWHAHILFAGSHGYLRQLPAYQAKDGNEFSFYATKSIWVFGEGQAMLIQWIPEDLVGTQQQQCGDEYRQRSPGFCG